jgi:chromosome segregation ATPase
MEDDPSGLTASLANLPQRIASLLELLTSLDTRVIAALDSIDQMTTTVTALDPVAERADEMADDIHRRLVALDERLNRDLDELKVDIKAKLADLDLTGMNDRLDRLEGSISNIERATVNLDQAFEGGMELLPDFVTKRMKGEGKKSTSAGDVAPPADAPPPGDA